MQARDTFQGRTEPSMSMYNNWLQYFHSKRTTAKNRVEHQKSVIIAKKFEKRIIDFQKTSKTFLITTYKKKSRRTHNYRKKSYIALMKLIKRYHKIRYLISTSKFKEHIRTHLKFFIEKTWCPGRRNKNDNFLLISVHADMVMTKRSTIERKMSKFSPIMVNSLLEQNCKLFNKNALWKKYNLKPSPHDEKTHAN